MEAQPVRIYIAGDPNYDVAVRPFYESLFGVGNVNITEASGPAGTPVDTTFSDDTTFTQYDIVIMHDIVDIYLQFKPAHVTGLVNFINQGGHVVLSLEGNTVAGSAFQAMQSVWNGVTGESITQTAYGASGTSTPPRFHPSNGPWGLSPHPNLAYSTQSYANFGNVFPENVIHQRNLTPPACNNIEGVNIVYPARPNLGNGTLFMTGEYAYPYSTSNDPTLVALGSGLARMHHALLTNNQTTLNQINTWTSNVSYSQANLGKDTMLCGGGNSSYVLNAGTNAASYAWSTGESSNSITVTTSGTYSVTVTSSSNCVTSDTVIVTMGNVRATYAASSPNCPNATNGSITVTPVTGNTPFQFSLNNGAFGNNGNFQNLAAGSYNIRTQDGSGCIIDTNIVLTAPNSLSVSVSKQDISCYGVCSGTATAQGNGGSGNLTYNWTSGITNTNGANATQICAGNYGVTVTDVNGCTANTNFTILEPAQLDIQTPTTAVCADNTTTLTATASGGAGATIINWIHNNTTFTGSPQTFNIAADAIIRVYASDANSCRSDTININVFKRPAPVIATNVQAGCAPLNTQFNLSNSSASHNYNWDFTDGGSSSTPNPQHTFTTAGNYNVQLIAAHNTFNCADTSFISIQVNAKPVISPSADSVCQGWATTFIANATYNDASTTATWAWQLGDNTTSNIQNPTHTYATGNTYAATLTVTSNNNCQSDTTFNVVVYAQPIAAFTAANTCSDAQPVSFINNASIAGGSITQWDWQFGDGNSSNAPDPQHSYSTFGNFNVLLTVTSNHNCVDTITKSIAVMESPTAGFTVQNVCADSTVSITNNATPANITYEWNFGNGQTSTQASPTLSYTSAGLYIITQVVTLGQCKDTTTNSISIRPNPEVDFSFSNACFDEQPISFTNNTTISGGHSIAQWDWQFGDGGSSTIKNPQHSYSTGGVYDVLLTATSSTNCIASITRTLEIFPSPTAGFSIVNSLCTDSNVAIVNTATPANNTYEWNFGNGQTSTQSTPALTYPNEGTYTVTQIAILGQCRDTATNSIIIHPNPVADFTVSNLCFDEQPLQIINNSSISSGNIAQWNWQLGDGNSDNVQSPQHNYATEGTYTISLTATSNNNCVAMHRASVTVYPSPVAGFTVNDACADSGITIVNTAPISNATTHVWYMGDGQTSTATIPDINYPVAGTYTITQIATYGLCSDTAFANVTIPPNPEIDFYTDIRTGIDDGTAYIPFTNNTAHATQWFWNFGDGNTSSEQSPTHLYDKVGLYDVTLYAITNFGCADSLVKPAYIKIIEAPRIYIPNTFSPNNDGSNEIFSLFGSGIRSSELNVFNRWGEKIFSSTEKEIGWDGNYGGTPAPAGTYIYTATIVFEEGGVKHLKGSLTLLR